MPKTLLTLLLLIGLLVPFVYNWSPQEIIAVGPTAPPKSLTKTYLINTKTLNYDKQGMLTQILEAARIEQYDKKRQSLLIQPRMYSHVENDQSWSVRSDRGRYLPHREIVHLRGNVVFTNDQRGLTVATKAMKINLKNEIAESGVAVTIKQGSATTTARGMIADLKKEQIRMRSNVETVYVPTTL